MKLLQAEPLIENDLVVFGLLGLILFGIFYTASGRSPFFKKFYKVVPVLLLCYFIPGIFNSFGVISGEKSQLYAVAADYFLPASLVLFTLSLDLKGIWRLRKKAGLMMLAGTAGIIIGGPIALYIVSLIHPAILHGSGGEEAWRGLSTIAGSWIGGSANQAAMFEVFKPSSSLFSAMIAVDVLVANFWLAVLLYGAGITEKINKFLRADDSALEQLKQKMAERKKAQTRLPELADTMKILGLTFAVVGLSQFLAGRIASWIKEQAPGLDKFSLTSEFLWLVVLATLFGILLSFTKARSLEDAGASRLGSVFLYFLIAIIGMNMNILAIIDQPFFFLVAFIWILVHALFMFLIARWTKSPFFFLAVGSQANVGGAASAPIVASAFDTALAPVGVLLAVLGYAIGTYGAYLCGILMSWI